MRHLFGIALVGSLMISGCDSSGLKISAGDLGELGEVPCSGLDRAACAARSDCRVDTCPSCTGPDTFIGCSQAGGPAVQCGLGCALPCGKIQTSAETCNARPDCHAVFEDPGTCDCAAPGCCMQFTRCAEGPAQCSGSVSCARDEPICGGSFVVSYTSNCYEGCVLQAECM